MKGFQHHLRTRCAARPACVATLLVLMLLAGGMGCSGSEGSTRNGAHTASAPSEEARRQAALERLQARQEAACEQVGDVLFTCAVEDARATMSPEELAALDVAALEPQYKAAFRGQCTTSDMSLRQVEVFEGCLADTTCDVFVGCLDAARPRP
jgi:hypothetical protein